MHNNAQAIFSKYALPLLKPRMKILEAGIGKRYWQSPYRIMAKEKQWEYRFFDLGNFGDNEPDFVRMNGEYEIDYLHSDFDAVISQQTIEHVRNPFRFVAELARVVKTDGLVIVVAPVTWQHHKNPRDCFRILPDGMRAIFEEAKLVPVVMTMENLGQDSSEERKEQFGKSLVIDCIGIGKK